MNEYVERLLKPISDAESSGPDLEYGPIMSRIDELAAGTRETAFSEAKAEPPDWRKLQRECEAFLERSKHLKPAATLCVCLVKQSGLSGLRDGVQILSGLATRFWGDVYPRLDDDGDATIRLNWLDTVNLKRGPLTEWLRLMNHIYEMPFASHGGRNATLTMLDQVKKAAAAGEDAPKVESSEKAALESILASVSSESHLETLKLIGEIRLAVDEMDQFLTETLKDTGGSISFQEFSGTMDRIAGLIQPYSEVASPEPMGDSTEGTSVETDSAETGGGSTKVSEGSSGPPGIRNRDDILRSLDLICAYYDRFEPSSPVPLLLKRARGLVGMDFLKTLEEFSLAEPGALKSAFGSALPPPPE